MTVSTKSLKELFLAAVAIAPENRADWLQRECGADSDLRERLELMLAAHDSPQSLLDQPGPVDAIARVVAEEIGATTDLIAAYRMGTAIGPYKLLQQIGEGGMGVVYMAEQTEPVKRRVALKIIKPGMDTRQVIARFEAERQALSLMDHPNIAKVLDAGTTANGRPYFVMELVKGQPITQYCDEHHLTPRQRLELLLPVCQAVQHAHQKGIIHRDIKPTNILVAEYDQQPVPKVIDFGVAKAISQSLTEKTMFTGLGQIVGTLEYMSPEQAKVNQLDIDTRSDIYSLGVLLYELLTGSTPFDKQRLRSAAFDEMLRIIREEEPEKPSTRLSSVGSTRRTPLPLGEGGRRPGDGASPGPSAQPSLASIAALRNTEPARLSKLLRGELDWIVMKALEKDRNRRYEAANGLAADLQHYLDDEPVSASPPSVAYRARKFIRRNTIGVALVACAVLVVLVSLFGLAVANTLIARERNAKSDALVRSQISEKKATDQKTIAEANAKIATEQRGIAVANENRAKQNELLAQRRFYASQVSLAMQAWRSGEVGRALLLLEGLRGSGEEDDLRGFDWYYLWGLCQGGDRRFLRGHTGSLRDVAFAPSGKELASASWDGTVRIWDVQTGQQKHVLSGHTRAPWKVIYSPDGKLLASSGLETDSLILWDVHTGQRLHTIPGAHFGLAFSADSKKLAAAFVANVKDSVFTPKVWDVESKAEVAVLPDAGIVVGWLPDGKSLVTHSRIWKHQAEAQIWDWTTGAKQLSIPASNAVNDVALSPDGSQLAFQVSYGGQIVRFDTATGKPRGQRLKVPGVVRRLQFSADNKRLACGTENSLMLVFDLDTETLIHQDHHSGEVRAVAFAPDGRTIAAGSIDGGLIKLWDGVTAPEAISYFRHNPPGKFGVFTLRFTPDSKSLIAGDGEPFLQGGPYASYRTVLLDASTGEERKIFPLGAAAISADAATAVSWIDKEGQLTIWELAEGRPIAKLTPGYTHPVLAKDWEGRAMPRVALLSEGKQLATYMPWPQKFEEGDEEPVKLWDVASHRVRRFVGEPPITNRASPLEAVFSPSGKMLAAAYNYRYFIVWDVASGAVKLQHVVKRDGQPNVHCVAFSLDESLLAVGDSEGKATVWEIDTGRLVAECHGHVGIIWDIDFSPDGQVIATAGLDRSVRLWDAATGQERLTLTGHSNRVVSVAFSPDGHTLASADTQGNVRIWRGSTHPEAHRYRAAAASNGPYFRYADQLSRDAQGLALDPDPNKWNPSLALAKAEKAASLQPEMAEAHLAIGIAHYRLGSWSKALAALEKAHSMNERMSRFGGFFLAMSHFRLGNTEQAKRWYERTTAHWDGENSAAGGTLILGRRLQEEAKTLFAQDAKENKSGR